MAAGDPVVGESWHNGHHADPTGTRHGALRGQIDPGARLIWIFEKLGRARDVRWPDTVRLAAKRNDGSTGVLRRAVRPRSSRSRRRPCPRGTDQSVTSLHHFPPVEASYHRHCGPHVLPEPARATEPTRTPRGTRGARVGGRIVSRCQDAADLRLHVRQRATGDAATPCVLLHGLAVSHRYLMPTAVRLGGRSVYVPDLPGFGLSGTPHSADMPGRSPRSVEATLSQASRPGPRWLGTSVDDPGLGQTRAAVESGVEVVIVCGGDGTVMSAVPALVGTKVSMAVLPAGTGNLLAANLGPSTDLAAGLAVALEGGMRRLGVSTSRRLDVGMIERRHFAVMAGMNLDAHMLDATSATAKAHIGWPAYVLGAIKTSRADRCG